MCSRSRTTAQLSPLTMTSAGAGAGVVVGGHREAVGAGAHDGEQVALGGVGQLAVAGEVVAATRRPGPTRSAFATEPSSFTERTSWWAS